jgi:hypothetical protein
MEQIALALGMEEQVIESFDPKSFDLETLDAETLDRAGHGLGVRPEQAVAQSRRVVRLD